MKYTNVSKKHDWTGESTDFGFITLLSSLTVGDEIQGENCLSTIQWISPFPQQRNLKRKRAN